LSVKVITQNLFELLFLFLVVLVKLFKIYLAIHRRTLAHTGTATRETAGTSARATHSGTTTRKATLRRTSSGRRALRPFALKVRTGTTCKIKILPTVLDVFLVILQELFNLLVGKRKFGGHLVHLKLCFLFHGKLLGRYTFSMMAGMVMGPLIRLCCRAKRNRQSSGNKESFIHSTLH